MKYSNIKSTFIKKKIKTTTWENRSYIDDLIQLHKYMITGINSWVCASLFSDLTYKYKVEYLKLIDEDIKLNPNEKRIEVYPKQINDMELRNKKIRFWKKEELRNEKVMHKDLLKSGGNE